MKIYSKEYGWTRVYRFRVWIRAKIFCLDGVHYWEDLGDPCYCGSDNCFVCGNCGFETHD